MVKSGLSVDLINAKIKSSKTQFDTSPAKLTELKKNGISETILVAMVESGAKPTVATTVKPNIQVEAARTALKALRRLNSATDVGISYVNYSPLVAEVKAEVEDSLPKIDSDNLRREIKSAMDEYAFAASVWQATWRSDLIEGNLKEIAINQYNVQKKGWLKVVWRNDLLTAIWGRAKNHFAIAEGIYTQLQNTTDNPSNTDSFAGAWKLTIENNGQTVEFFMTIIRSGENYTATLRSQLGNSTGIPVKKTDNTFSLTYSEQQNKQTITFSIQGVISENALKGNANFNDGKETKSLPFSGTKLMS